MASRILKFNFFVIFLLLVVSLAVHGIRRKHPVETVFKWKTIAYGPTNKSDNHLVADYPFFVRENILPSAVAYHVKTSMLFIASPRLKPGVIATLNSIDLFETFHLTSPIWTPYPNLKINELKPWHFPEYHEEDIDDHGEYQDGEDCNDGWKKGPGFCRGFYEGDRHHIPSQYLPEEFLDRERSRRRRYRSKRSVVIRLGGSTSHLDDPDQTDDDDGHWRPGSGSVRNIKSLISVNSLLIDQCDRLWFIDTGVLDYGLKERITVQRASLWVVDIRQRDKFLIHRRFEFPEEVVPTPLGLRGFAVDIPDDDCSAAVAYIANAIDHRIVVYDMRKDDSWFVADRSMEPGPVQAAFLRFPEIDIEAHLGVTDVAVGWPNNERGDKSLYFMPFASQDLFSVSTSSLRRSFSELISPRDFTFIGSRGRRSQSESMVFDSERGILFFAEAQTRSIKCWNAKENLDTSNIGTLFEHENLDYPAHLSIDSDGNLWVLSNRYPVFLQFSYDHDSFNVHLFRIVLKDVLKETNCQ